MQNQAGDAGHQPPRQSPFVIRPCTAHDQPVMLAIINAAAEAYRGVIPADCWHAPYMTAAALQAELGAGVAFFGCVSDGVLAGVMGLQHVSDVALIRHAYVLPAHQGSGIGHALLAHLRTRVQGQWLVGTWAAADWAIRFYQRCGFHPVADADGALLLRHYWQVSPRQIETSVVLAAPALDSAATLALVPAAGAR